VGILEGNSILGAADPIFALIASYNAHRQQEWVVAEPEEFQPFDLQALRNSADNKPIRSSSRRGAYVPQTARLLRLWTQNLTLIPPRFPF
jgi:hypothetical protein